MDPAGPEESPQISFRGFRTGDVPFLSPPHAVWTLELATVLTHRARERVSEAPNRSNHCSQ